jgi:hypothetical protein
MFFVVLASDAPGTQEKRNEIRPIHRAHLLNPCNHRVKVHLGGPTLTTQGDEFGYRGDVIGFGILQARGRVDLDLVDFFRMRCSHFLDVHAAFARGHQHDALRDAVGDHRHIEFLLDVGAFFDQQAAHFLAFRAGLVGDQLHAEDLVRVLAHLLERLGHLHAAALAATACMNLRLDDPDRTAEGLGGLHRFVNTQARDATRHRDAVLPQDFFSLVLMDFHAVFPLKAQWFNGQSSIAVWFKAGPPA